MSNDRSDSPPTPSRTRRGSVTSAALSTLFQRSSVGSNGSSNGGSNPSAAAMARERGRRLSVTTLGLSGTGPAPASAPFAGMRRSSLSTNNSDSVDENAIDEDDVPARTAPTSPFARRMSFGAQAMRQVTSPSTSGRPDPARRSSGGNNRTPPSASSCRAPRRSTISQASTAPLARAPSDMLSSAARPDQGFNWSEQLRSRAESAVSGMRPVFGAGMSSSPPRTGGLGQHDRAKSVSDMPAPPQQAAAIKPKQPERPKPDHMQERILKGDFYMD